MEIENANFNKSFVEPAVESARRRVPEETPASKMLKQILPNQPPATSTDWKMEGVMEKQSPGGSGKKSPLR